MHEPPAPRLIVIQLVGHPRIRFGFGSAAARAALRNPELVSQKQVPSVYKNAKAKQSNVRSSYITRAQIQAKSCERELPTELLFHVYASVVTLAPCLCLLVNCLGVAMASPPTAEGAPSTLLRK